MVTFEGMSPRRDSELLGISATTFLTLCLWLGPQVACSLIFVIAIGYVWFAACRRWPIVAVFTVGLIRGLFRR